jgi:hypothetical protein
VIYFYEFTGKKGGGRRSRSGHKLCVERYKCNMMFYCVEME